ncbi:hypothetical protein BDQ12DRAFT_601824 [Crucibulum laeve]|uniref:Arrestin-like N-terminal domain-containing protein n=1 Tax=Crucibulum laeve TaxID=68775 RepID=A0A5C3M7U3_9AGAR|nr:hypothetical protein BDQ12DRAFT_601824 [Crucibulum laeve]
MSELDSSASVLPSYSPSVPAPLYSSEPACGELLLEHTPRSRSLRPPPTSSFIKKMGSVTLVLNEQEENVDMPSYGRHAVISGTVCFGECHTTAEVIIQIEGKLDSTISEGGSTSFVLVKDTYTLWKDSNSLNACPSQLPFTIILPSTYQDGGESRPLPPTYEANFPGVPALFVRSSYRIHVTVRRIPNRKIGFWTKTKRVIVPFKYTPRTRSHRPIVPTPCFFSSVKTSPEEWYQAVATMKTRTSSQLSPINCHLFVPAARIYGLIDIIPFHVQLTGRVSSLKEFFSSHNLDRISSADSHISATTTKANKSSKPMVRLYLLRQVAVDVAGEKGWRNSVIGEGTLYSVPPALSTCYSLPMDCREENLDWEGELRVNSDITCGSFQASNVHVKDFIALSLKPPNPFTSPLLEMQLTVPIRFVTDSWGDTTTLETGA